MSRVKYSFTARGVMCSAMPGAGALGALGGIQRGAGPDGRSEQVRRPAGLPATTLVTTLENENRTVRWVPVIL